MRLTLHVKPHSKEMRMVRELDGTLTISVTAPAEKGKANRELVKWIAKKIGVSSSHVRLIAGAHSRIKVLEIDGLADDEVLTRLGVAAR